MVGLLHEQFKSKLLSLLCFPAVNKLSMKPEYKPLKELTSKVKNYKTKVKVVHKGYPQKSPNKPRYQRLVLEDEEGFTMKATLFNNDIEKYAETLQRKGDYEIDDATVKPVPETYASRPNEFSIVINDRAKINPMITGRTCLDPEYQPISTIPKDPANKNLYDVLRIVLYVSAAREVERAKSSKDTRKDTVQEVHIIDQSHDRPFSISLWNEIITVHELILASWADSFNVFGFVAITGKSFKGFTMSSTMSTAIIATPQGKKADALREWAAKNKYLLIDHRSKLAELSSSVKTECISEVQSINDRKAHNTWQEETFTIRATIPAASFEKMHLYIGCSKCSRKCNTEPGCTFKCEHCFATDVTAEARVVFKFEVVDKSGKLELPLFGKHVEEIVGLTALEMWTLKENGRIDAIAEKMDDLRKKTVLIKIGPTIALTTSRVLSWAVRSIAFEPPDATEAPEAHTAEPSKTSTPEDTEEDADDSQLANDADVDDE